MDQPTEPSRPPPPADLELRAVRPEDAEAVAALMNLPGFLWGTSQIPFLAPERVRARIEKDAHREGRPDSRTIVATTSGNLVGQASLERNTARRSHVGLIGIGVHDDWVGRGIGSALMAALVDLADNWLGLRRIELTVMADNAQAVALYRRFGFAVEGTHRGWILRGGALVDVHTMARLQPAPA